MKKIGLLSDTHSVLPEQVFKHFSICDEIWHAGDIGNHLVADQLEAFKPLRAVFGNIDDHLLRKRYPAWQQFVCEGVSVWMTHIGGRPGRYVPSVRRKLKVRQPDLFICGHSHILCVKKDPTYPHMYYLNPGAAGIEGIHHVSTLLRFELDQGIIRKLEVIRYPRHKQRAAPNSSSAPDTIY